MKFVPNLLIVDDSPLNLFLLKEVIGEKKVNLIQAISGREALEKIQDIDLALAIIDVRMPVMNGFELAVEINKNRCHDKVPIIFLTAQFTDELAISEGYASGAVDYIIKPFNNNVLRSKINIFLELFKQKQIIIKEAALQEKYANELYRVNEVLAKSEDKYRSYIENAPNGVFVVDETGKYLEVNHAIQNMTGYSKNELLHMSFSDIQALTTPDEKYFVFDNPNTSGSLKSDLRFNHKDGGLRWLSLAVVKLSEKRFLCFTDDITPRTEMEEALQAQQVKLKIQNREIKLANKLAEVVSQKYTDLYDFAPTAYFTISLKREIKELNHSGARMLGKDRAQLIGGNFTFFISLDTRLIFDNFLNEIINTKTKQVCEIALEINNEQLKFIHVEGIEDGNNKYFFLNIIDITERINTENALKESEANLLSAQQISHLGSWEWDMVTNTMKLSREMFRIFNITSENFNGKNESIVKLIHPDDLELFMDNMKSNLLAGIDPNLEYRITHKDGSTHNLFAVGKTEFDESGNPTKSYGTVQDITELKLAEQALKVNEEKYRSILNSSPDGIILVDLNGYITEISDTGFELFSANNKDELLGKNILPFIPSISRNILREINDRMMNEGLVQNIEISLRKKNGLLFEAETSVTLIHDTYGQPYSYMIIIRDISQRKKIETMQFHADRMANLGELASGIAHEINQPLNIISLSMDNILIQINKDKNLNTEFLLKKSDKIFENITRINNIIDHVRDFSHSNDDFIVSGFDINTGIVNAYSMMAEQFKHLAIHLKLELMNDLPAIKGNIYKFEQVIINLLSNAKDAVLEQKNRKGGNYGMFVIIKSFFEEQNLIVEIVDNGTGISIEDIDHIMLPFYTTKESGKGTGLGLSISYQIIKEMKGTIEVLGNEFGGTTIKISL